MPRKIRGPADLVQNRQNQRRCRARRNEYVAALEARLREYEASEVQASIDMQRAARAVVWKSERLVMLLARHGVSQEEVNAFLQLSDEHAQATITPYVAPLNLVPCGSGQSSNEDAAATTTTNNHAPKSSQNEGVSIPYSSAELGEYEMPANHAVPPFSTCRNTGGRNTSLEIRDNQTITICNGKVEDHKFSTPTDGASHSFLTSCDTAASIIADLQGHGDAIQAREVLGCGSKKKCHVKNTRLFQLIDEAA
ncbi:hypothetical protein F5X99DRAFT_362464 [Biscogniauxia marginata]|nr:hypothetical protein F5X99DRAFT_362464 [Biscogniauxia marginata]